MHFKVSPVLLAFALLTSSAYPQSFNSRNPLAHTFSIVARDEITGEMAVGVQSHWFSVGTAVSWAEAGAGAIATQSFVNKSFGIRGHEFLKKGYTAQQTLDSLLQSDEGRDVRQVAIIDTKGNVATHTGKMCISFASHIKGKQFSVQSNMMLTDSVCKAMAAAFENSHGKSLAEKVLNSLEAGQRAGGDIRGKQSAAIVVVPAISTGKPWDERIVDIRVDDNIEPLKELRRLYTVHLAYQHMNDGDVAMEKHDMNRAMQEYAAAMKLLPGNIEMQYWTAITLANNKQVGKALPLLKKVYLKDKNWKELTKRLVPVNLLNVSQADLQRLLAL